MTLAIINRYVAELDAAFTALGAQVPLDQVEHMAMLVHPAMEARTRAYHRSEHVFALCDGMQARQRLAALFHDVVYFQLDGGFPPSVRSMLEHVVSVQDGGLVLQTPAADDTVLRLCCGIFGFAPGQTLPLYGGMNEFLSAVVAARLLQAHLGMDDLLGVLACIEATIAFRAPDAQGHSAAQSLAQRLHVLLAQVDPSPTPAATLQRVHRAVADAVALANRDVGGFAVADPGLFLSSTWLLIEESNAPQVIPNRYTTQEYRMGLCRMGSFLRQLDAAHIFQVYRGVPDTQALGQLQAAAQRNIAFACDFLDAKTVSIAVVEALVRCTGPDVPISMFLGDIRSAQGRPDRAEDYLPTVPAHPPLDAQLLQVLEQGRAQESAHDLTASPLTAFMYRSLGQAGMQQALVQAQCMFDHTLSPLAFLHALDRAMVSAITQACARIALSRRASLLALLESL